MFSKKKSSKSDVKNIVTLNIYADKNYIFKNDLFKPLKKLTFNKNNFITSYVSNKDLITTTMHISRSIPDEDIADYIDIKAYEELGLDQATQYTVTYHEVETDAEEREFHLFVAEPEVLDALYLPLKNQTKYIDLILPAPLLYKVLYKKEILRDNNNHCFIYFTKNEASITIYKNGQYLYSKFMEFSLEQIYDKYCELIGEKVDEKEFYKILETEGLKTIDENYQKNFMKIFGELFIIINDIIIYAKRAFELDGIDQMFIGSQNGPIIGLDDYSQNYLGLDSIDFNFNNYDIKNDEWYTDQLQYLMLLSTLDYIEDSEGYVNLTMYPRPPSFMNRASGQFIIALLSSILLSLIYPMIYFGGYYLNSAKIYAYDSQDKKLTIESNKYKAILEKKRAKIKLLEKKLAQLLDIYNSKTETLRVIYNKKVNYRLKSATFYILAKELNKFDLNIDNLRSDNDTFYISLVSSNDRKITKLIQYISDKHFNDIVHIDIDKIQKDPQNNYYRGLLTVEFR